MTRKGWLSQWEWLPCGSAVSLATYFAVGGPFGAINDVGNAATGVLSAALAGRLRRRIARPAVAAALMRRSAHRDRLSPRDLRNNRLLPGWPRIKHRLRRNRPVASNPQPKQPSANWSP